MGLENTLDYLNAQECREISSHDAGMEKFDKLAHSAMTNKILSDIIYQVFLASTKEKYKCNIAISEEFNGLYENEEIFKNWIIEISIYLNSLGFKTNVSENVISLDWSKDEDEDIDDEYDEIEKYENMHKQKSKKQHAPKKHNLRVIIK